MPQSDISTWLGFALQQIAAESYLDNLNLVNTNELIPALTRGNNHLGFNLTSYTRMPDPVAEGFVQRYQIRDHHANDATGFSATLLYDTQSNSYTLSFRSTEFRPQSDGGDRERDGAFAALLTPAADGQLSLDGFAFGQLAAMENYYQSLKDNGLLPNGATLNVTGYSLGGHLANVFTTLHYNEIAHTYVFNGAGRGAITGPGATDADRIRGMLDLFRQVLFNPDAGLQYLPGTDNPRYQAAAALAGQSLTPFIGEATIGGAGNLYTDARLRWAVDVATTVYDASLLQTSPGQTIANPPYDKITQLYGLATTGDLTQVANTGIHGNTTPVFIEGQPLLEGVPLFEDRFDFGNTHALTLLVDSLAVQNLIQHIDSRYGQASAELLIKAASNSRAEQLAPLNTDDVTEGDSLEKTVDALRKIFQPTVSPLPVNSQVGGFGDFANRNEMYTAMAAIREAVRGWQDAGATFTLVDLNEAALRLSSDPASIENIAQTDTAQGLAYRYALKELNPFAVVANTSQANDALYASHNDQGQLDLFNPADGTGTLTAQYLDDRALFLAEKIALNLSDRDTSTRGTYFLDVASDDEITPEPSWFHAPRQFIFGSDDAERLEGASKGDHIYGGDGVDVLIGNGGQDYLEGGDGSDRLEGGTNADRMFGGRGNDTYVADDLGDEVIEGAENGNDTVESSVTFTLGANVEDLTLTGTADLNGTGNELDNLITGNDGINRLDGKGGTDHLIGGIGNDILLGGTGDNDLLEGGAGFDTYIYNAGDGSDRIEDEALKLVLTA
jgi:hypothetical protein